MSEDLNYVEAAELADILKSSEHVAVVDVRDKAEFDGGRIKGAINHPSDNWSEAAFVESVAEKVTADGHPKKLVFHCAHSQKRGPTCARILQARLDELVASGMDTAAIPAV